MLKNRPNSLGKYIRKLRIENNEDLKDMASKLNISASYLSAIELGKRHMSEAVKTRLIRQYKFTIGDICKLNKLINENRKIFKCNIDHLSKDDKEIVFDFVSQIHMLDGRDKEKIKNILKGKRRENENGKK